MSELRGLTEVADGVWVRQSGWVWTNTTVVRTDDGLVLVDPGIEGAELEEIADDLERLGIPVVAGFSTHPHEDHLLWHPRLGDVPRYATEAGAQLAAKTLAEQREAAAGIAPGVPLELVGLVTPVPADGGPLPGELIEHAGHCIGHAAVLLVDQGVLLAGDMLSDVLLPILDSTQEDQLDAYAAALEELAALADRAEVVVPGHGTVGRGAEVSARLAADRAYIEALRRGNEPTDSRLEEEWMAGIHESNLKHRS